MSKPKNGMTLTGVASSDLVERARQTVRALTSRWGRRRGENRIVVLEATRPPDATTRYIDQIVTDASPRFDYRYLSWRTALTRFDVLHLHWPESFVRSERRLLGPAKCAILLAFIELTKLRRVPIVRTLHNLTPHELGGACERWALASIDKSTDFRIGINPVTPLAPAASAYIPHGHYRGRFARHDRAKVVPGRLLCAGLIRPYKGVEELLSAFAQIDSAEISLRIVGRPTVELRQTVEEAVRSSPKVSARLEFVPDNDFVEEITAAELVCLPYTELHNSGILMVALSLDRPVLVRRSAAIDALEQEVGDGWIFPFSGELSPRHIESALRSCREPRKASRPRLEDRDWDRVAARYEQAFLDAMTTLAAAPRRRRDSVGRREALSSPQVRRHA